VPLGHIRSTHVSQINEQGPSMTSSGLNECMVCCRAGSRVRLTTTSLCRWCIFLHCHYVRCLLCWIFLLLIVALFL
jgi:hypothetical protein